VSWQRVRGHDRVVQAFARAVERGRLAHAYLFTGPPGVGKRLFAGELARALLCEKPPAGRLEACDACPACIQVDAGTHPDFFATGRPEDRHELPIEVMRELCQNFGLKSARGRGKVAILDDADDLNEESANCFLKTLEEPPPRSLLLLIGTSPDRQLPTILSRCQVIRFAPLPAAIVREILAGQDGVDAALIDRLVRLGAGSPGQALALADPALWEFRKTLVQALRPGSAEARELAPRWLRFVEEAGKESATQRRRASLVLRLLIDLVSNALALAVGGTPALVEPADLGILQDLGKRLGPDELLHLLQRFLEADHHIDRRVQLVLAVEALVDSLQAQVH
jgi:DNA polymerase-3 subunit delta'